MSILIDNIDFWDMQAMKYWSFPKSYDNKKRQVEAKNFVMSGNYIGARKIDGAWEMIIKDSEGNFHMRSRTEGVNGGFVDKAEWVPHIIKDLDSIPNGTVLIGEIYLPNNEGSRKVTSVLNCLKDKCLERQEKGEYLHFYVFDVLAYKGKNIINEPIEKRINHYLNYELLDVLKGEYIELADYKEGQELWDMYGEVLASGGEGIVITKKSAVYAPGKRTARMTLKMKKELQNTIDAFVDGKYKEPTKLYTGKEIDTWPYWINEKTGERFNKNKYSEYVNGEPVTPVTKPFFNNWASAISLSVLDGGHPVHIAWISGITDNVKEGIIKNPKEFIGKVVELTAMEIQCVKGEYSLRHGKIERWRDDKAAADCTIDQIIDN